MKYIVNCNNRHQAVLSKAKPIPLQNEKLHFGDTFNVNKNKNKYLSFVCSIDIATEMLFI